MLSALGIGLFFGITVISIGIGAVLTPLQSISAPFVCGGPAELETQHYSYKPGQSGYTITWYCTDPETGEKVDRTFPLILASGVIYGVALGLVILAWGLTGGQTVLSSLGSGERSTPPRARSIGSSDSAARLEKLRELRESGLITEAEYSKKKAEILEEL
jgi:hypothetical protein